MINTASICLGKAIVRPPTLPSTPTPSPNQGSCDDYASKDGCGARGRRHQHAWEAEIKPKHGRGTTPQAQARPGWARLDYTQAREGEGEGERRGGEKPFHDALYCEDPPWVLSRYPAIPPPSLPPTHTPPLTTGVGCVTQSPHQRHWSLPTCPWARGGKLLAVCTSDTNKES